MAKAKDELEFNLKDIDRVHRAIADLKDMKVDVEYDENDDEFSFQELITTVQESGNFLVLTVVG